MQFVVEEVNSFKRRLTITVPPEKMDEAYHKQIKHYAMKANVPGFRPGKVPVSYVTERFGNEARQEALQEVIKTAFYEAIKQSNLNPISQPSIEPKPLLDNQALEFVVSFEILPELKGPIVFNLNTIEKLSVDVKPEDIDYVIEQIKKQHTKWNSVTRAAQNHDRLLIDFYPIFSGEIDEKGRTENFSVTLGSNMMIPGFEAGLIGAQVNEERRLQLQFPEQYHDAEKAGKPVEFIITIKQIDEPEIPEMDEHLIRQMKIASGSMEDLQQQIRSSLELERDRLLKEKLKEQIFTHLLETNQVEVPDSLIEQEAKRIHDEIYYTQHDHHQHSEDELTGFKELAKKRVALSLLISEYVKQLDLKVDQNRVAKRIAEIAAVYEKPQEVEAYFSAASRRSRIESEVLEDQLIDHIMDSIQVVDKVMSYTELKGIQTH